MDLLALTTSLLAFLLLSPTLVIGAHFSYDPITTTDSSSTPSSLDQSTYTPSQTSSVAGTQTTISSTRIDIAVSYETIIFYTMPNWGYFPLRPMFFAEIQNSDLHFIHHLIDDTSALQSIAVMGGLGPCHVYADETKVQKLAAFGETHEAGSMTLNWTATDETVFYCERKALASDGKMSAQNLTWSPFGNDTRSYSLQNLTWGSYQYDSNSTRQVTGPGKSKGSWNETKRHKNGKGLSENS